MTFFPQKKLLANCQIKIFEHFRYRDLKFLPYQSTYKDQKFFIKILILINLVCNSILLILFLFRSLKILEIKREKCQTRKKKISFIMNIMLTK